MPIIHGACAIMQENGNTHQWVNGYPSRDVICQDIARGDAWLVTGDNGDAVGYFVFRPGPDPTYRHIYHGAWLNDAPYHVIHRIAGSPHVHGIFDAVMRHCQAAQTDLRIDTHRDNHIMRHLIAKYAFIYCGIIHTEMGDERLAYQLVATP